MQDVRKKILLGDNQDLTKLGLIHALAGMRWVDEISDIDTKKELTTRLLKWSDAIVILDYTLFDFSDASELINISDRFRNTHWILMSEELSTDFLKRVIYSSESFSIIFKDCSYSELILALEQAAKGERFICSKAFNILTNKSVPEPTVEENRLTTTEREVLQLIALGKTTKEIAAERNLSFHTINAHRKNIFRKLEVNNIHEATKYAIRAGIIDMSDYYI
ncbi:MAG: DNA-binding response regulator [Bacteroidetes bacterium]|jgi:DNA-binding NarL/FixJ family response regulator|nr:DNA-binding response regulator [Bacteroidota bacterium]